MHNSIVFKRDVLFHDWISCTIRINSVNFRQSGGRIDQIWVGDKNKRHLRWENSRKKIKRKLITNGPFSPLGRPCEWRREQYWTLPCQPDSVSFAKWLLTTTYPNHSPTHPPQHSKQSVSASFEWGYWPNFHDCSKDIGLWILKNVPMKLFVKHHHRRKVIRHYSL